MKTTKIKNLEKIIKTPKKIFFINVIILFFVGIISLGYGAVKIPPKEILIHLVNFLSYKEKIIPGENLNESIIIYWRLPRLILAMLVGASLAVAGAGYQAVFKNPLADPFLLGSAAGAGLGASIFIVFDYDLSFFIFETTQIAAFVGAFSSVIIAYLISRSVGGSISSLLLAGIATASFLTACQTFLMQKNINSMQEIYGWLIGRLITSGWAEVIIIFPYFVFGFLCIVFYSKQLDLLRFSNEEAKLLGGKPLETKIVVLIASSLITAAAVSVSGLIAFVGLVIPHVIRLLFGYSYKLIIPLSAIAGASFLCFADTFSRIIIMPGELPIGVITAFIGAPFFAFLLRFSRGN